jgi:acetyltransferase-like isoleucine patch superfamily enzyme
MGGGALAGTEGAAPPDSLGRSTASQTVKGRWRLAWRVLMPQFVAQLFYFWKHRAFVSGKAEVEIADSTDWGRGCVISAFTKVKIAGPFRMGRRVQISTSCFIGVGSGGLSLGDDVLVSPNCTIVTSSYRFDRLDLPLQDQGSTAKGVRIGDRVWIGANSAVLDGAVIGDNVIVSAGSVVSGTIKPNSVVLGNPAKVIFTRR